MNTEPTFNALKRTAAELSQARQVLHELSLRCDQMREACEMALAFIHDNSAPDPECALDLALKRYAEHELGELSQVENDIR